MSAGVMSADASSLMATVRAAQAGPAPQPVRLLATGLLRGIAQLFMVATVLVGAAASWSFIDDMVVRNGGVEFVVDERTAQISVLASASWVVTAVWVALWSAVAAANARRVGAWRTGTFSAFIGWLIPLVNLFLPWSNLRRIARSVKAGTSSIGTWRAMLIVAYLVQLLTIPVVGFVEDVDTIRLGMRAITGVTTLVLLRALAAARTTMIGIDSGTRTKAEDRSRG